MGERSAISWTSDTWNPWRGCDKVSPGCAHCYMFTAQERYGHDPSVVVRAAPATFRAPFKFKGPFVFTCSWSDWFHETADPWRNEAWDIIRRTPHLTYQILTKRPERMADHLPESWGDGWPNVWLDVSVENRRFVNRADALRRTPAAVRFISAEPLLGPLIAPTIDTEVCEVDGLVCPVEQVRGTVDRTWIEPRRDWSHGDDLDLTGIDWLIVGGESGPNYRPMDGRWVRDIHDACTVSGTAFFFKQDCGPKPGKPGRFKGWPQEYPKAEVSA